MSGDSLNQRTSFTYELGSYGQVRAFLADLAALSERCGFYPNLHFDSRSVRVSIEPEDGRTLAEQGSPFVPAMEELARARAEER
jgi:pterin-4a-carbinolamine dehydratase